MTAHEGREELGFGRRGWAGSWRGEEGSEPRRVAEGGNVLGSPEGQAGVPPVFRGPDSGSPAGRGSNKDRCLQGGAGIPGIL